MLQIVGYFEGRGDVLAYTTQAKSEFVANVFRSYLGSSWTVEVQPKGTKVEQGVRNAA